MGRRAKEAATTGTSVAATAAAEATAPVPEAAMTPEPTAGRRRWSRKRTRFQEPKQVPVPVRALWRSASEEERRTAHRRATAVLRAWLGEASREEAAAELGLTPLRFWQLSQQAVAGLVAGCLRQPRFRGRAELGPEAESVGVLRRRILVLEREVEAGRRLIGLLRDLPGHREAAAGASKETRRGGSGRRRAEDDGATASGGGSAAGGPS